MARDRRRTTGNASLIEVFSYEQNPKNGPTEGVKFRSSINTPITFLKVAFFDAVPTK